MSFEMITLVIPCVWAYLEFHFLL